MTKYKIEAIAEYQFMLVLNPMQSITEAYAKIGPFPTKEVLIEFYKGELVEPYTDEAPSSFNGEMTTFQKTFRRGGPLEWMNPLHETEFEQPGPYGHGIHEVLMDVTAINKLFQLGE